VNSWEHHRITPLVDRIDATWSIGSYRTGLSRWTANPLRLLDMFVDIARTSAGLVRDVRRVDATHVLVPDHVAAARNVWALLWFRLRGGTVIMRLGNAPDRTAFYAAYWRWFVNAVTDRFVCNSRFTEQELLALGLPSRKVSVVHNCLPSGRGDSGDQPRIPGRIVYVGQIIPGKGLHLLLDAVALVAGRGLDVTLDVVGDIDGWTDPKWVPYRKELRARAAAPDLAGRVAFLGWRDPVAPYLARASVHCAPSLPELREGFGLVNLEAKAAATPSVVFASGAFPELFTHLHDGWICRDATAAALAEGLEYFLSDPDRLIAAQLAARQSLVHFDREVFAARWWRIFEPTEIEATSTAVVAASLAAPPIHRHPDHAHHSG
jgi:glycosyltransferase involved in cell wall biosynthesis